MRWPLRRPTQGSTGTVWDRLAADSTTAHRRLTELDSGTAPGPLGDLLRRAREASTLAVSQARAGAATGGELGPSTGLDVPHDPAARRFYEDLGVLVGKQRSVTYRAQLLTVPTTPEEHRFQVAGLTRAVVELEELTASWTRDPSR